MNYEQRNTPKYSRLYMIELKGKKWDLLDLNTIFLITFKVHSINHIWSPLYTSIWCVFWSIILKHHHEVLFWTPFWISMWFVLWSAFWNAFELNWCTFRSIWRPSQVITKFILNHFELNLKSLWSVSLYHKSSIMILQLWIWFSSLNLQYLLRILNN